MAGLYTARGGRHRRWWPQPRCNARWAAGGSHRHTARPGWGACTACTACAARTRHTCGCNGACGGRRRGTAAAKRCARRGAGAQAPCGGATTTCGAAHAGTCANATGSRSRVVGTATATHTATQVRGGAHTRPPTCTCSTCSACSTYAGVGKAAQSPRGRHRGRQPRHAAPLHLHHHLPAPSNAGAHAVHAVAAPPDA